MSMITKKMEVLLLLLHQNLKALLHAADPVIPAAYQTSNRPIPFPERNCAYCLFFLSF